MVVVVEGKLVVLPQEWQEEGALQEGQTDLVEEVGHHIQNLKSEAEYKHGEVKRPNLHRAWTFILFASQHNFTLLQNPLGCTGIRQYYLLPADGPKLVRSLLMLIILCSVKTANV